MSTQKKNSLFAVKKRRCPSHLVVDKNQCELWQVRIDLSALQFCTVLQGPEGTIAREGAHVPIGLGPTANPGRVRRRRGAARHVGTAAAVGTGLTGACQVDVSNYTVFFLVKWMLRPV